MNAAAWSLINAALLHIVYRVHAQKCSVPDITNTYISNIFTKYSGGSTGLNNTALQSLLKALKLDKLSVVCEEGDTECQKEKLHLVGSFTDPLSQSKIRKRRAAATSQNTTTRNRTTHRRTMEEMIKSCNAVKTTLKDSFQISQTTVVGRDEFLKVCPFLLGSVDNKACVHYHARYPEFKPPEDPPSSTEKWGYGVVAITICSMLSLTVIAMIPCLNKSFYDKVMAFLVALAVGTLCGDALLHLIPHAFIEGANKAAGIEVSEHQEEKQHKSQVYRALIVMAGIYLFFVVEQMMKLKGSCGKSGHTHVHGEEEMINKASHGDDEVGKTENHREDVLVETGAHSHAPTGGHGHSHGDKNITGETNISTVAWMVVVGDGFHNFSDGLATGAAFSASISSGVSTTIAIFCHELPHELGDFAVLLKAGMTIKQAITYNLVGAVLSYIGLAIGILAGTNELGRHIILCLTAGLFLYISLVNMMTEVVGSETDIHNCSTLICQHLGMLTGIGIMLLITIYE